MPEKNKFVVEYTNKDIMDKLTDTHDLVVQVSNKQDYTNGKVKNNRKLIYCSFVFSMAILGWFVVSLIG